MEKSHCPLPVDTGENEMHVVLLTDLNRDPPVCLGGVVHSTPDEFTGGIYVLQNLHRT